MNCLAVQFFSKKFLSYKGKPTGMQYGTLSLIHSLQTRYATSKIFFLWEGFESVRKAKSDTYKRNRGGLVKEDGFRESISDIKTILPYSGVKQYTHIGLEADDLAGYFVNRYKERRILLVSTDRDWWQFLVPGRVDVLVRNTVYTYEDAAKALQYPPDRITLWKTLKGDVSDNVPGVKQFPEALALDIVQHCSTLNDIRTFKFPPKYRKWKARLDRLWDSVVKDNYMLVAYHPEWIVRKQIISMDPKKDAEKLKAYFHHRGMTGLAKRFGFDSV